MKSLLTSILLLLFAATGIQAQSNNYILLDQSTMQIEGTSTIHDWECDVEEINADISFDSTALQAKQNPVKTLSLTIPVKKIDSGKGGMNNKIYDALKNKKHPNITFELTNAELADTTESNINLTATGMLNIAGVSREVSFPVEGIAQADGSYKFSGEYELNMKDYEVDPPSAIFGTIKSGEMVTISFEFYIAQQTQTK